MEKCPSQPLLKSLALVVHRRTTSGGLGDTGCVPDYICEGRRERLNMNLLLIECEMNMLYFCTTDVDMKGDASYKNKMRMPLCIYTSDLCSVLYIQH